MGNRGGKAFRSGMEGELHGAEVVLAVTLPQANPWDYGLKKGVQRTVPGG